MIPRVPPPPAPMLGKLMAPNITTPAIPGIPERRGVRVQSNRPEDLRGGPAWTGNNTGIRETLTNNQTGATVTCQLNGGVHQCCYWIVPKGHVYPADLQQCRVKTALVGVDMDFYRCCDPFSATSIGIDRAYVQRRIARGNMRGRQYFCYHHLGSLFGVIPRPGRGVKGLSLRAIRNFPAYSVIGTFSQNPITEQDARSAVDWPTPRFPGDVTGLSYTNSMVATRMDSRVPEPAINIFPATPTAPAGGLAVDNNRYFDPLCYKDLGDYATDARNNGIVTRENGIVPGCASGAMDTAAMPTTGLRNPGCWNLLPGEGANAAIRRVRYRYFEPPIAEPVRTIGIIPPGVGIPIERLCLYTTVAVNGNVGPGRGVDIVWDRGNDNMAQKYCPTPTHAQQKCVAVTKKPYKI